MGCCCGAKKAKQLTTKKKKNNLELLTSHTICQMVCKQMVTINDRQRMKSKMPWELCQIMSDPYIHFSKVMDHLFLTGVGGIVKENILDNRIECIVNVTFDLPIFDCYNIETLRVPVDDIPDENIGKYFDKTIAKIDYYMKANRNVVVHCKAGVSRSATIVIAYLMCEQGMTLRNAYRHVWKKRKCIHPNHGFIDQLINYEKKLFNKTSLKIVEKNGMRIADVVFETTTSTTSTTEATSEASTETASMDSKIDPDMSRTLNTYLSLQ